MSRSITMNGVKATIIFHDTISDNPNDKPTINWELVIETGDNKAMIDGSITTDVRFFDIPVPATATAATAAIATAATDTKSLPEETLTQKSFNDCICKYLIQIESTNDKKEKADIAIVMFKKMTDAVHFVENQKNFKKISIERAYYLKFKEKLDEFPELIKSIDTYLLAIGASLNSPICNEDVDPVMLKMLFQEENLTFNMEYMNWYYTCAKKTPRLNRSQKMKAFIDSNKNILMQLEEGENENRKMLMLSIFKKKNLEFKDVYMDMYYKWQKNAPKQNRYKKMCAFIEAHGFT